jgi:hypothetical protein
VRDILLRADVVELSALRLRQSHLGLLRLHNASRLVAMISDAYVEVTCDYGDCRSCDDVELRAGANNTYLYRESDILDSIKRLGWIVNEYGQFCCKECLDAWTEDNRD